IQTDRPGMSTYLALTFGTLLSSQGTDTSFEPLIRRTLRALRSFVFRAYQMFSAPFSGVSLTDSLFPSAFRRFRLYQVSLTSRSALPEPQEACAATDLTACLTFQTLADPRFTKRIQPQSI
ncbi:hypothetical protein, partial [Kitasatospora sp. Root107]|uniref:hypothetical protein n=1 Tax=Kitasatospora sp. Root107 TaxID=1736424 RepID=UPI001F2B91AE